MAAVWPCTLLTLLLMGLTHGSLLPTVEVFAPFTGQLPCWRIPALVVVPPITKDGPPVLLAFSGSRCYPGDGCNPTGYKGPASHAAAAVRKSIDGGRTWGSVVSIFTVPCVGKYPGSVILQPNAVYDPVTHRVHALVMVNHTTLTIFTSHDDGSSWAPSGHVTTNCDTAPGNGVRWSKTGRLLLLGQCGNGAYAVASDDHGSSWRFLSHAEGYTVEPQAVERPDGTLFLKGHTNRFDRQHMLVPNASVSSDGGDTWKNVPFAAPFNLTTCQGGLAGPRPLWSDGAAAGGPDVLYFSHPNVPAAVAEGAGTRYNGAMWRSIDGGIQWDVVKSLTRNGTKADDMFAYSVLAPISQPSTTSVLMGVLYETGGDACGDDPRYHVPAPSCRIVFTNVTLSTH